MIALGYERDGCVIRFSSLSLNFNFLILFWGLEFMEFIGVCFMFGVRGFFPFHIEVMYLLCSA